MAEMTPATISHHGFAMCSKRWIWLASLSVWLLGARPAHGADQAETPVLDLEQDLEGRSVGELRVLRNTVFARHGYAFTSGDLECYFSNQAWYERVRREMRRTGRRFEIGDLSAKERAFVSRIDARERAVRRQAATLEPGRLYDYEALWNAHQFPRFPDDTRDRLEREGFVLLPGAWRQFHELYDDNSCRGIPSFITADSVVHLVGIYLGAAQRRTEQALLLPLAKSLVDELRARALAFRTSSSEAKTRQAASMLASYFAVAAALYSGANDIALPDELQTRARHELSLVRAHESVAPSVILGGALDYREFRPRDSGKDRDANNRFFLGTQWLRTAAFRMSDEAHQRALLVLTHLLYRQREPAARPLIEDWQRLQETLSFFEGAHPEHGPADLVRCGAAKHGSSPTTAAEFTPDEVGVPASNCSLGSAEHPVAQGADVFRFLPQVSDPVGSIVEAVTHPDQRRLPAGLDVLAVLGSREAKALLDQRPCAWPAYPSKRKSEEVRLAEGREEAWLQSLPWAWMKAQQLLARPASSSAPRGLRGKSWRMRQLQSALATLPDRLGQRAVSALPPTQECGQPAVDLPLPRGYVEPTPELYTHLEAMVSRVDQLTHGVNRRLDETTRWFKGLLDFLASVSRKELAGHSLSDADHHGIWQYGSAAGWWSTVLFSDFQHDEVPKGRTSSLAAATDLSSGEDRRLAVAVGLVDELFAVVEIDGRATLTRGGTYSYYEFESDRAMSEKEWYRRLRRGPPSRPAWVSPLYVPASRSEFPSLSWCYLAWLDGA